MNKKSIYTVDNLIKKLEQYDGDSQVFLDFNLKCLLIKDPMDTDEKECFGRIALDDWIYDYRFLRKSDNEIYYPRVPERFRYVSVKEHGRRIPSFIRDYLTMKDYFDLEDVETLLNALYSQCRANDLLRNELINLRAKD